jgi:hypothetical protein
MSDTRLLQEKWAPILNANGTGLNDIKDPYRRKVTATLLENQERSIREEYSMLNEISVNSLGASTVSPAGSALSSTNTAGLAGFDPILISLIRRSMPNLIAYDIAGVQPMSGPTGLIFAMRARYQDQAGQEALYYEPDEAYSAGSDATQGAYNVRNPDGSYSGTPGTVGGDNPAVLNDSPSGTYGVTRGMSRETSETLGDGTTLFREMAFSIEKTSVTAKTRALKADYTLELAQDLKAIHGLDAEQELANILSSEILAEINREIIRTVYTVAQPGAQQDVATPGTFDLDVDSNGRWQAEKFKGMLFQLQRDANAIGQLTRRGKGNFVICSADVASALNLAGALSYAPDLNTALNVDDTGNVFAGVLQGGIRVYIDPFGAPVYSQGASAKHYYVMGYKGTSPYDAGLFYCPYVPLQMVRSIDPNTFQPKIGFKTRYGMVSNPFVSSQLLPGTPLADPAHPDGQSLTANTNQYYRRVKIINLT